MHLESGHFSPSFATLTLVRATIISLLNHCNHPHNGPYFYFLSPPPQLVSAQLPCLIMAFLYSKPCCGLGKPYKPAARSVQASRASLLFLKYTHSYSFLRVFALAVLFGTLLPQNPLGCCPCHFQIISQISSAQQGLCGACFLIKKQAQLPNSTSPQLWHFQFPYFALIFLQRIYHFLACHIIYLFIMLSLLPARMQSPKGQRSLLYLLICPKPLEQPLAHSGFLWLTSAYLRICRMPCTGNWAGKKTSMAPVPLKLTF